MSDLFLISRLVLGLVFIWSSLTKVTDVTRFSAVIDRHNLLPTQLSVFVALFIIVAEAMSGLSLLLGIMTTGGLAVASCLLLMFSLVMAKNARRDQPLPCYCFGFNEPAEEQGQPFVHLALTWIVAGTCWFGVLTNVPSITARPTAGPIAVAIGVVIMSIWIMMAPMLWRLHRLPVPEQTSQFQRVSFEDMPLVPIRIDRGESS